MEEYQDNSEIQSRILEGELGHYKASNRNYSLKLRRKNILMG
jgi:hypothetical protein